MTRTKSGCGFCKQYCGQEWCVVNIKKEKSMVMSRDLKYFDSDWGMSPYGENKVLFLAEYLALQNFPSEWREKARICIETHLNEKREWYTMGEENLSHDNFTAIVCLSSRYGFDYHKDLFRKDLIHSMLHPRDAVFYLSKCERWYSFIGKVMYPISLLAQMHSCYVVEKRRGDQVFLRTDGKLLTWLRCRTFNMRLTSLICTFIIKNNELFKTWKKCFGIYFKDSAHPNNLMPEESYEL